MYTVKVALHWLKDESPALLKYTKGVFNYMPTMTHSVAINSLFVIQISPWAGTNQVALKGETFVSYYHV